MNSTLIPRSMTGGEIVDLIVALEKDERIVDKMPSIGSTISDFAHSIDDFPDHIRRAMGDRILANGVDEASAVRRAIMASKRGYASIAFYLESVENIVRINSYGEQDRYTPPVQMAQSAIAGLVEELGMGDLDGDDLAPRHHELIVAAHFLSELSVTSHNYRSPHDYHVALEMIRTHLGSMLDRLDVVISQNYLLVPTMSMADLVVCIAAHPEIDPERIMRVVKERGFFSPDIIDSIMQGDVVPLDHGVL